MSVTSFQRGDPNLMSDDNSGTTSTTEPKTDWRRLRSMTDEEVHAAIIDDPDANPTDEVFWKMRGIAPVRIPGAKIFTTASAACSPPPDHGVGGMFAASGTIIMSNEPR
jgi:hypothetical protein